MQQIIRLSLLGMFLVVSMTLWANSESVINLADPPFALQVSCVPVQGTFPKDNRLILDFNGNVLYTALHSIFNGSHTGNVYHKGIMSSYLKTGGVIGNIQKSIKVGFAKKNRNIIVDLTSVDSGKTFHGMIQAIPYLLGSGLIETFATGEKVRLVCNEGI